MHHEFIFSLGQILIIAVFGLMGAVVFRRSFRPLWFVGALSLYVLYNFLLTRAYFAIPNFPPEADWNWLGKIMSLAGMMLVALLPVFGLKRAGITLHQNPHIWTAWLLLLLFFVFFFSFAVMGSDGRDDFETILFQWTMPGFDEEVFYRGVLLLAMNEAFRDRMMVLGAPIGYGGLLTCVLFGLAHGLSYGSDGFAFDWTFFAITGGPSVLLLWLREKTGSIVMPIIAHNVANGAFTLF
ncbi:CPBP family intramembrane glutamic endopeptidase [Hyphococcus formosus]|uniref:CPBP family intramembrane glutamic endopeptidase, BDIM_20840 family n=1 Tax=Hyphococcus formosus TaxID=3143534 RepID=UPI00398BAF03